MLLKSTNQEGDEDGDIGSLVIGGQEDGIFILANAICCLGGCATLHRRHAIIKRSFV